MHNTHHISFEVLWYNEVQKPHWSDGILYCTLRWWFAHVSKYGEYTLKIIIENKNRMLKINKRMDILHWLNKRMQIHTQKPNVKKQNKRRQTKCVNGMSLLLINKWIKSAVPVIFKHISDKISIGVNHNIARDASKIVCRSFLGTILPKCNIIPNVKQNTITLKTSKSDIAVITFDGTAIVWNGNFHDIIDSCSP